MVDSALPKLANGMLHVQVLLKDLQKRFNAQGAVRIIMYVYFSLYGTPEQLTLAFHFYSNYFLQALFVILHFSVWGNMCRHSRLLQIW
jgi:hypothetical protein